eukprot:CAMPEP_0194283102 /NCGR_PEP_ID=MMETSP0169-20130528/24681_1 /TAXON_ID=218684 /ORGANISM="Corethron pennatum, Strain L29A3" /LENGTH=518 /DNA_ID=CAMNT_0039028637 /DNA_START=46 /DNA_END=1602 /DNA_ORIENTATION=-
MGRKKSKRPASVQEVKVGTESESTSSEIDSVNDETNILFEDPSHEWAFELVEAAHAIENDPVEIVETNISLLFKKSKKIGSDKKPKGDATSEPKISGINSATASYYGTNSDTVAKNHDQNNTKASVAGPNKAPDQLPKDNWMIELRDAKDAIGRLVNHALSDSQLLISKYYTADVRKKSGRKSGSSRRKSKKSSNGKKWIENIITCALSHAQQIIFKMYTVVMCTSGKNLMGAIEKLINDALSETRLLISKYYAFDICEKSKKPGSDKKSKDGTQSESKTKKSKRGEKFESKSSEINTVTDICESSKNTGSGKKSKRGEKIESKSSEINTFTDTCKKSKKTDNDKKKGGALSVSRTNKVKSAIKYNKTISRDVAKNFDRDITKTSLESSDEVPKDRGRRRRRKKKKWNEKQLMSTAFKIAVFIIGVIIFVAKNKVAKNKIVEPATDITGDTSSTQTKGTLSKEAMDFFRLIDTDKSGNIQREEIAVWIESNGIEGVSPDDADLNMLYHAYLDSLKSEN